MMQFAKEEDMPEITAVWEEGFGDTKEEIEEFFSVYGQESKVCIWKEDNKIAGQLVLIPAFYFAEKSERKPIWYLYAVATAAAYRNRGVATRLLCEVTTLLEERKEGAVLVPAGYKLAEFYEKRGFIQLFGEEKILIEAARGDRKETGAWQDAGSCKTNPAPIDVATYFTLRSSAFENTEHIALSKKGTVYAVEQKLAEGYGCYRFFCGEKEYGVLYRYSASELLVAEITAAKKEEAVRAVGRLMEMLSAKSAILQRSYLTYGWGMNGDLTEEGYFNLVLD